MNIIETVRGILESFPKIAEVVGEVHIDFAFNLVHQEKTGY